MITRIALLLAAATFLPIGCTPKKDAEPRQTVGDKYIRGTLGVGQNALGSVGTSAITQAISRFQAEHGRNPNSLAELQEKGLLPVMPQAPIGKKYSYDPAAGSVTLVPK